MPSILLALTMLVPIICGLEILFLGSFKEKGYRPIIIGGSVTTFLLVLIVGILYPGAGITISSPHPMVSFAFKLDEMGVLFTLLVSLLWIFTSFYAFGYMEGTDHARRFYGFFIIALGVTLGIGFSANLVTLYMFYEILTFVTYPLVIHTGTPEAVRAGKMYLIYSLFGAGLAFTAMFLLSPALETYSFIPHGQVILGLVSNGYLQKVFILMFIGFGVKAAIFPLHAWLLGAMAAPTPVSALLHAVAVVKSGIFALTRVIFYIFGYEIVKQINVIYYLGILIAIMIVAGSLLAIGEKNLKRRLAYSTIAQLGYIMMGLILLTENSIRGGLLHIVNHAFIKITLFFCIGTIIHMTGKTTLAEIEGLGRRMPITMTCFTVSAFSLMGIPPLNGFISKSHLVIGALDGNFIIYAVILIGGSFLTAAYLLPIMITGLLKKPSEITNEQDSLDPPKVMLVPMVILTVINFILGIFPNIILGMINGIVASIS